MASSMLHVRVDESLKAASSETLGRMGLSVSDAVRMLLRRVVEDQALPRELIAPGFPNGAVREERATFASVDTVKPRAGVKELDVVRLLAEVVTEDGDRLTVGTQGTIVHCYGSGRDFEVEFAEPAPAVMTLRADEVEIVWQS